LWVFEDLFEAVNIHKEFCVEKKDPQPSISLLNATNTFPGYVGGFIFGRRIIKDDEVNALQKELLLLFEGSYIFGFREFYKKLLCILVEIKKTMNEIMKMFQENLWTFSCWVVRES
jgi:hypothetical protein